jgi:aryl-alcohol dehydrogenase-like predicted oxidoreductase
VLKQVAARRGATPYEIALAWILGCSSSTFAIPGATRPESIASSVRAQDLQLSPADRADLGRAFPAENALVRQLIGARRRVRHVTRNLRARFGV